MQSKILLYRVSTQRFLASRWSRTRVNPNIELGIRVTWLPRPASAPYSLDTISIDRTRFGSRDRPSRQRVAPSHSRARSRKRICKMLPWSDATNRQEYPLRPFKSLHSQNRKWMKTPLIDIVKPRSELWSRRKRWKKRLQILWTREQSHHQSVHLVAARSLHQY